MDHDDPFFNQPGDEDRTVIRPTPGGRRTQDGAEPGPSAPPPTGAPPAAGAPPPRQPPPAGRATAPLSTAELGHSGLNPLASAAAPLLTLVTQLRHTLRHPDPEALRRQVIEEVKAFENRARGQGVSSEVTLSARYVLCSLVDETILGTPWGAESSWGSQGMLISFHKEAWGGEKFFALLDHLLRDPLAHLHLLELMYLCLTLGFEGRYRVMAGGQAALADLREKLYRVLRQQRGEYERELSPHWRGVVDRHTPLSRSVPLWVLGTVAAALLLVLYVGFSFMLNRASDPVFASLHAAGNQAAALFNRPVAVAEPTPAPDAPRPPTLRELLNPEILAGQLDVTESDGRSTVILHGDGLFASGSVEIRPDYLPVLRRVAEALAQVPGDVLVTGHTDNVPIHTLRFPSNWHLSQRRAESVVEYVGRETGTPGRFTAEGRAETEPLVPNDTRDNRARNRRVEITLVEAHGRG